MSDIVDIYKNWAGQVVKVELNGVEIDKMNATLTWSNVPADITKALPNDPDREIRLELKIEPGNIREVVI